MLRSPLAVIGTDPECRPGEMASNGFLKTSLPEPEVLL